MTEQLDRIEQDIRTLTTILTGNGDPGRGLVVRVDRLEQTEKSRVWWLRAVAGVALGAMAGSIKSLTR